MVSGMCPPEDVDLRTMSFLGRVGSRTCGIGDLLTLRRVDSVVPRKSLSLLAGPDRSRRPWFGLICLLALVLNRDSSEYRIGSM